MFGYIYLTTNLINKKQYIGRKVSTKFLGTKYLGSGTHLKNAIKKYGKENFQVSLLEECNTYEELIAKETEYIIKHNAVNSDLFYNSSYGGEKEGFILGDKNIAKTEYAKTINKNKHAGKKMSTEFCELQRQNHLGKPSGMLGHKHSDEAKAKMSQATREMNLNRSPEIYNKVSESAKGNKMMHKDDICIRVHPEEFSKYLSEGWQFGGLPRKSGNRNGSNNPMYGKSANKNKKWIHKGTNRQLVLKEDLDSFLQDGWELGIK